MQCNNQGGVSYAFFTRLRRVIFKQFNKKYEKICLIFLFKRFFLVKARLLFHSNGFQRWQRGKNARFADIV